MINAKNFGIALGTIFGAALFIFTIIGMNTATYGQEFFNLIRGIYPGYNLSLFGSFLGLIYGFIDGFIGGFFVAWVYNFLQKK